MTFFQQLKYDFIDTGNVVKKIIFINAVVFIVTSLAHVLFWLAGVNREAIQEALHWISVPLQARQLLYQPWSIFTYMFLHQQLLHIIFNMLVLFWFGGIFAEFNNGRRTWGFYLLGGLFGAVLAMSAYEFIPAIRGSVYQPFMLGASASIMALVVGAATQLPNYQLNLLLFGPVKLKYLALFYVIVDLISLPDANPAGHTSHLGGALLGFVLMRQLQRGNDIVLLIDEKLNKFVRIFRPKPKLKVVHRTTYMKTGPDVPSQEQIDAILDKISQSGYESLSEKEKAILFKASKND